MRVGGGEEGWSGDVSGVLTAAITAAAWAMGIDATVLGVLTGRNLPGKCSWRPEGVEPARLTVMRGCATSLKMKDFIVTFTLIPAPGQAWARGAILQGVS